MRNRARIELGQTPQPRGRMPRRRIVLVVLGGLVAAFALLTWAKPLFVLAKLSVIEQWVAALASGAPREDATPFPIAHRGHGVLHPSRATNSAASLEVAREAGYRVVEVDVTLSADLVPFLAHDDHTDFGPGLGGHPEDLPWASIAPVGLKDGQPILLLADFWRAHAGEFDAVWIDLKGRDDRAAERAAAVSAALPPRTDGPRVFVIGLGYDTLRQLVRLRPDLTVGCEYLAVIPSRLAGFKVVGLSLDKVTPGHVWLARRLGVTYFAWNVATPDQLAQVLAADVDGYTTDEYPLGAGTNRSARY